MVWGAGTTKLHSYSPVTAAYTWAFPARVRGLTPRISLLSALLPWLGMSISVRGFTAFRNNPTISSLCIAPWGKTWTNATLLWIYWWMCVCARTCVHMTMHICMFMSIYVVWVCVHLSNEAHTAEFLVRRYNCLFYHCAQTHGFLPRKQSPAHSVAFCSISELGETKAACWLYSKPTGTGCFPPEEGGVHTLNQKHTRGSHPGHLIGLPKERT